MYVPLALLVADLKVTEQRLLNRNSIRENDCVISDESDFKTCPPSQRFILPT